MLLSKTSNILSDRIFVVPKTQLKYSSLFMAMFCGLHDFIHVDVMDSNSSSQIVRMRFVCEVTSVCG